MMKLKYLTLNIIHSIHVIQALKKITQILAKCQLVYFLVQNVSSSKSEIGFHTYQQ